MRCAPILSQWFSCSFAVLKVKHFLALSLLIVRSITDTSVMPTQSVTSVVVAVVVACVDLLRTVPLAACVKC